MKNKLQMEKMPTRKENTDLLIKNGVRPTIQQLAVLEYLQTHKTHPTVEEIHSALYEELPTLAKPTVYNILKRLSDAGVIQFISIDEKSARFDGDNTPHAHFKCKKCGKIVDIEQPKIKTNRSDFFEIHSTQVYYTGYCFHCKNQKIK